MMQATPPTTLEMDLTPQWRPLRVFNWYRIVLGTFLLAVVLLKGPELLGEHSPALFISVSSLYILFSLSQMIANAYRWPDFAVQVYTQAFADIAAITLLTYASGGVTSGLGVLMIAAIAGVSLLIPGRTALFFAAVGALALLLAQSYATLRGAFETTSYMQTGILGASIFATALVAIALAGRVKQTEALAARRGLDLANLAQLNDHIVNRMSSGTIVVDDDAQIRLINQPAWKLLGKRAPEGSRSLEEVSFPLYCAFSEWQSRQPELGTTQEDPPDLSTIKGLIIRIRRVGARKEDRGAIIYLEDAAEINRQIQQSKLASLGRLTASIAHEIRNPLGAISHAAQLLSESQELDSADQRLVGIINDHSKRMNEIIQNILQLSRKEQPKQDIISLKPWLERFVDEFGRVQNMPANGVSLAIDPDDAKVMIDHNHLHQVLWNLCTNAAKYGTSEGKAPSIDLRGGASRDTGSPYLDVIDHGPGIDAEAQAQLFEPFFTTSASGTGLGLYICRQLCENNGADLSYIPNPNGGSCFRIRFPVHEFQGESSCSTP